MSHFHDFSIRTRVGEMDYYPLNEFRWLRFVLFVFRDDLLNSSVHQFALDSPNFELNAAKQMENKY